MISGDNHTTAVEVATQVGIPENCVVADVLPHKKVTVILALTDIGIKNFMVTDANSFEIF